MYSGTKFKVACIAPNGLRYGMITSIYTTKLLAKVKFEEDLKMEIDEGSITITEMPQMEILNWARMYTKTSDFFNLSFEEKVAHCKKYDL